MGATSAHFTAAELACSHCGVNNCTTELVTALEALRSRVGHPVHILSGYRCPIHNAAVGGVPASQHLLGTAADVTVPGMTTAALESAAAQCHEIRGIGRDDHRGFVHVDVRRLPARWCYTAAGKDTAWYPPGRVTAPTAALAANAVAAPGQRST
jgi:uncharacterized protein YcbK (DUF882 family)